ncbi:MAG: response regulator [Deltaproteobacteria bacterium]|nr:response regulator [Deltaproteobacteria bacterium]
MSSEEKQILIVEDDEFMLRALERFCSAYGQTVAVSTVRDALKALDRELAAVVLDVKLPDGSGLTVLEKIREKQADLPVLVLTGLDPTDIEEQALSLKAEFLSKSDDSSKLKDFLRRAI